VTDSDRLTTPGSHAAHRAELWRDGITMALYVSLTLLATLFVLPRGVESAGDGLDGGVHGLELIAVIWGTTLGLALMHWFAFTLASRGVHHDEEFRADLEHGAAQFVGAGLVALGASVPVLLSGTDMHLRLSIWVPAVIVGGVGYLTARANGRGRGMSLVVGGVVLAVGVALAAIKLLLINY
jgi:hypothetical protein